MNWARIQAVATPMELTPRPEEGRPEQPPRHEAATLVVTLAAYAVHAFFAAPARVDAPEVVRPVPVIDAAADCRAQNEDYPVLWMQCEEL